MQFQQVDEGNFRIYIGTMEGPNGDGYIAAVVVSRLAYVPTGTRDVFRDDALAGGHRWARPDQALSYAMGKGRAVVQSEQRTMMQPASACPDRPQVNGTPSLSAFVPRPCGGPTAIPAST